MGRGFQHFFVYGNTDHRAILAERTTGFRKLLSVNITTAYCFSFQVDIRSSLIP